jgi:hypothetical protein
VGKLKTFQPHTRPGSLLFSPVSDAQGQVPLPHVSRWVHTGKETEVWMANQGFCAKTFYSVSIKVISKVMINKQFYDQNHENINLLHVI